MLSAWNAKIATSVSSSASTVSGWKNGRNLPSNHSTPRRRISTCRLIEPAASGITTKIRTE